ncbi:hypothetical protein H311_01096 [Anncaliia algerae PRA109]|nr:hypothetical protein H311_01096 [Anncaliia algerae PRA109]
MRIEILIDLRKFGISTILLFVTVVTQNRKLGFKSQENTFLSKDIKYLNKKLPPKMVYKQMNKLFSSTSSLKTVSLYLKHLLHNVYPCDQDSYKQEHKRIFRIGLDAL